MYDTYVKVDGQVIRDFLMAKNLKRKSKFLFSFYNSVKWLVKWYM